MRKTFFLFIAFVLLSSASYGGAVDDGRALLKKGDGGGAIQLFEQACAKEDAAACYELGEIYNIGTVAKQDYVKASGFYEKSCRFKSGAGCLNLAIMSDNGIGVEQNLKRSFDLFGISCRLGNATACYNIAVMYDKGYIVKRNRDRAISFFDESCNLGDSFTCYYLGSLYAKGEGVKPSRYGEGAVPNENGDLVNPDYDKVVKYYQKACDIDVRTDGCFDLANMYFSGAGVTKDLAKAAELFDKACSGKRSKACYKLADMYHSGLGINKDATKALELFKKSCELGDNAACDLFIKIKKDSAK